MRLINNTWHFTSFHPRFLFKFHSTRVIKDMVALGRVGTGKDGVQSPFLKDSSGLNGTPGGNKQGGRICFALVSCLTSLGLPPDFLIRGTPPNEEPFIVRNAPAPRAGGGRLEAFEGRRGGGRPCGARRARGALPHARGALPRAPAPQPPRGRPGRSWSLRRARKAPPSWAGSPSPSRNATPALPSGLSGKLSGRWLRCCPPCHPAFTSNPAGPLCP